MLHFRQSACTDSPFHLSILCLNQRFFWDITLCCLVRGFLRFHRQHLWCVGNNLPIVAVPYARSLDSSAACCENLKSRRIQVTWKIWLNIKPVLILVSAVWWRSWTEFRSKCVKVFSTWMYKNITFFVYNKRLTWKRQILYCRKFHFSKTPLKKSYKWKWCCKYVGLQYLCLATQNCYTACLAKVITLELSCLCKYKAYLNFHTKIQK
jgi:hypothetical protein